MGEVESRMGQATGNSEENELNLDFAASIHAFPIMIDSSSCQLNVHSALSLFSIPKTVFF